MFKALVFAATVCCASSVGAVTIVNGDFEIASGGFAQFETIDGGGSIAGWMVDGVGIDHKRRYWMPHEGQYSVDLNSIGAGAISQLLTGLTVGHNYLVTFWMSANPVWGPDHNPPVPDEKTMRVSVDGTLSKFQDYAFNTAETDVDDMRWRKETFAFLAGDEQATLRFQSTIDGKHGIALDAISIVDRDFDVTIGPIPLPGAGVVLLSALGLLGLWRKRASA